MTNTLRMIEQYRDSSGPIPLDAVRAWMESSDIRVQGQAADMISYPPQCDRIEPPLGERELEQLLIPYYRRCFLDDPRSDLADSRYGVATEMAGWFAAVPQEANVFEQGFVRSLEELLKAMYLAGPEEIRRAVVHGALEHILEEPRWRPFFRDWELHPVLSDGYRRAMEWARLHER
jgi:hypothetical protein